MKRYLITTADERSWKFDRPVLFLGEWCRLYDRKHVWEKMDAEVAAPYGLEPLRKDRDLSYLQSLSSQLLSESTVALNRFHGTGHTQRYWQIVIGQWLQRYIALAFNRYSTLKQALDAHEVSATTLFDSSSYSLATNDSLDFIWASNDDEWNHVFCGDVLRFLGTVDTDIESAPLRGKAGFTQPVNHRPPAKPTGKDYVIGAAGRLLPRLARKGDAFVTNTYLPPRVEARLEMSLGQFPQFWKREPVTIVAADADVRRGFPLDEGDHTEFERFVRQQLSKVIPTCYLEGYRELVAQTRQLPWPARPRFIFTSNNFDTDEPFKAWTASKVEEGIPYFTGQHGNNYGTLLGSEKWTELVTCDAFYTWGWSNGSPKNVPAFLFKTTGRKRPRPDPKGGLLLIELPLPHRILPQDSHYEFGLYQEDQFKFVSALAERIRKGLIVRLHPGSRQTRWSDEQRWADRSPGVPVEAGDVNILRLLERNRLVVHSYDSTGILETLAWNIPTLCFWQNGLDHLLASAKPFYELLREAGIVADTPEQAAALVNSRWDSIDEWWESAKVQEARKTFCAEYARTERRPVLTLRHLLLSRAAGRR
jgi:putative transferase (TIGR04331 family)